MPLTPRLQRLLSHRCDLWSVAQTTNSAVHPTAPGRRAAKTYTRVATDVPCYFGFRQTVEGANALGRIEGDNYFTRDEIVFGPDVTVDSDWVAVNKTLNGDGTQAHSYGRGWIILGHPQSVSQDGYRRAQHRHVEAIQVEDLPSGVTL